MANSPAYTTSANATATSERFSVLSIVAFVLSFPFGIVGAILGFIALAQIKRTGQRGHGLALAAVVIGLVLFVLALVFNLALLPHIMNSMSTTR